jgi:hypothetical protein
MVGKQQYAASCGFRTLIKKCIPQLAGCQLERLGIFLGVVRRSHALALAHQTALPGLAFYETLIGIRAASSQRVIQVAHNEVPETALEQRCEQHHGIPPTGHSNSHPSSFRNTLKRLAHGLQ